MKFYTDNRGCYYYGTPGHWLEIQIWEEFEGKMQSRAKECALEFLVSSKGKEYVLVEACRSAWYCEPLSKEEFLEQAGKFLVPTEIVKFRLDKDTEVI